MLNRWLFSTKVCLKFASGVGVTTTSVLALEVMRGFIVRSDELSGDATRRQHMMVLA